MSSIDLKTHAKPPHHGNSKTAETLEAHQSRLIPPPKVLQKALAQSAARAQKMADAFGLKVPAVKIKAPKNTRTAG